jgi:formiminotetrahydrofolate cyclodeaminase
MNASLWDTPLGAVTDDVAGAQPAPAGVAAAAIAATLGVSLLIKTLEISGQRPDLRSAAHQIAVELRAAADADCTAIRASLRSPEAMSVPLQAAQAAIRGLALCTEAEPLISGLLAADLRAGRELLFGSALAILTCIDANLDKRPSAETAAEVASLRAFLQPRQ